MDEREVEVNNIRENYDLALTNMNKLEDDLIKSESEYKNIKLRLIKEQDEKNILIRKVDE
jgi:hypothetical protein